MEIAAESNARDEAAAVRELVACGGAAYRLAVHVVGSGGAAEDVVQQAYLETVARLRAGATPGDLRAWFLRAVVNTARDHLRGEARRRRRESAVGREAARAASSGAGGVEPEMAVALRAALATLEAKYRLPLALCYQEELSQREAAAVLDVPETTLSGRLRDGIERLRRSLSRAGYAALPAGLLGALRGAVPGVPPSLAARVEGFVARGAARATAGAAKGAGAGAVIKGGIAMKLVGGLLLAGAVAAGVAVVSGDGGGAPLPAEKPKKFSAPVWDPGARWQMEKLAGIEVAGHLDGPRLEMEYSSAGILNPIYRPVGQGKFAYGSYDPATERGHIVAGWAQGYLDGPFSRARFGGWDYVNRCKYAASADGRYFFLTDVYNGRVLRRLDAVKQEVVTLLPDTKGLLGMTPSSDGRLYVLKSGGATVIVGTDGTTKPGPQFKIREKIKPAWGASLALDEKNGRIYASAFSSKNWYVWYWSLADGSFHGVLPIAKEGEPARSKSVPGPFKGTTLYNQGSVMFGPDDPDYRFLYGGRTDTWNFFRMDLEKKVIACLGIESGGRGKPTIVKFIESGKPARVKFYGGGRWLEDGSFGSQVHSPRIAWRFRRVK